MNSLKVASAWTQTIFGRGVTTSRTSISPNLKMFSSISPVDSSTVPSASPRSISVRSSPGVTIGLDSDSLPPNSRIIPRGTSVKANTTGHATVIIISTIRAVVSAHRSAATTASVLGVSSPTTTMATVAIAVAAMVDRAVGSPPPMVEIARVVPTDATVMLNRLPRRRIVPKNLS